MIHRILNFFIGYRKIRFSRGLALRAINLLTSNNIDCLDMQRNNDGTLDITILNSDHKKLISLLPEDTGEFETLLERGLPGLIRRYRGRIGIPIGVIIFLVLNYLSTQYIWEVTVRGNERLTDAEVIEELEELGCSVGAYIPKVDFYNICHEFILKSDDACWISVNMVGTTAQVELIEKNEKNDIDNAGNGTPSNIVAEREGVIVRFESTSGSLCADVGQGVLAGEILISGVQDYGNDDLGHFRLVRSIGKIFARTERTFEVRVALNSVQKRFAGKKTVSKSLKFFGKTIKLKENSSILRDECDIIKENKRWVLFEGGKITGGIFLPISLINEYVEVYEDVEVTLSPEEALNIAHIEMSRIFNDEMKDAEIMSKEVSSSVSDGELVLIWQVVCIEDIGKEVPIGIS